jgi:hypothetical protein
MQEDTLQLEKNSPNTRKFWNHSCR